MTDRSTPANMKPLFRGRPEMATYTDPGVDFYLGNPLIEALPEIWSKQEVVEKLTRYPPIRQIERELPDEIRMHYLRQGTQFFQPLSIHLRTERRLSVLLRDGYRARNPIEPKYWHNVRHLATLLEASRKDNQNFVRQITAVLFMIGISGTGKTTTLKELLNLYPQVIFHSEYNNRPFSFQQLVWLHLECPNKGSILSLVESFFYAVDSIFGTNYTETYLRKAKRPSAASLLLPMAIVSAIHGLGVLAIDEIQNINAAASGGDQAVLNFLVELVNLVGVSIVLMGNPQALESLSARFRMARRGFGEIWRAMNDDDQWELFTDTLWDYQYVRNFTPVTPALRKTLYEISTGIPEIAVKTFLFAQEQAIDSGQEAITEEILRATPVSDFPMAERVLSAIRTNKTGALPGVADIHLNNLEPFQTDIHTLHSSARPASKDGTTPPHNQKVTNKQTSEGSLLSIASTAKAQNTSVYEALQAAGYTRDLEDLLKLDEAV